MPAITQTGHPEYDLFSNMEGRLGVVTGGSARPVPSSVPHTEAHSAILRENDGTTGTRSSQFLTNPFLNPPRLSAGPSRTSGLTGYDGLGESSGELYPVLKRSIVR